MSAQPRRTARLAKKRTILEAIPLCELEAPKRVKTVRGPDYDELSELEALLKKKSEEIDNLKKVNHSLLKNVEENADIVTDVKSKLKKASAENSDGRQELQQTLKYIKETEKLNGQLKNVLAEKMRVANWNPFECGNCHEKYQAERGPRVLSCGHSICLMCAETLHNQSSVRCPFDNQDTLIDNVALLPVNYIIKK